MLVRSVTRCSARAAPSTPPQLRLRLRSRRRPQSRLGLQTQTQDSQLAPRTAKRQLHASHRPFVHPERLPVPSVATTASRGRAPRRCRRLATTCAAAAPTAPAERAMAASMVAGSSPVVAAAAAGTAAAALLLAPFLEDLDRIAPCFRIHGSQVRILESPTEFYETLKTMIRGAERRIFLATLYIGKSETELITTLQETLRAKPHVRLHILTDALRGTREAPASSCASLLAPLVAEFGAERVDVRMYHTPNLTGLRRRLVPRRLNEGWGLQHMKLYGVDDAILLSGANLSSDYFTNRQDRYHVFSSAALTDFYWRLHRAVASLSFAVEPAKEGDGAGFALTWPATNAAPSPLEAPKAFTAGATAVLRTLLAPQNEGAGGDRSSSSSGPPPDTSVYVLAQMTQVLRPDCSTEEPAVAAVLQTLVRRPEYAGASWTFTAGYFNPAPFLSKLLLETVTASSPASPSTPSATTTGTVITAAPQANGFYKSPGVSGLLPDAYTFLAAQFLRTADRQTKQQQPSPITLKEWRRGTVGTPGGWSYHAKGLWVTLPGADRQPALTLVGSSNYTKRSYALDLEANALVVTANADLQRRLGAEQAWLQTHAAATTRDDFAQNERRVRLHVRLAMWLVQVLGGAL